MGLFTGLVTLPLAPVRGAVWIAGMLEAQAERELYDAQRIRSELLALELEFEDGAIGEEEREAREQELLERLAVSQARSGGGWEEHDG